MAEERRVNPRVAVRVSITLEREGQRAFGYTLTVNDGGGTISSDKSFDAGESLLLTNLATGRETLARVVHAAPESVSARRFRVAVRLELHDGESFWGTLYRSACSNRR